MNVEIGSYQDDLDRPGSPVDELPDARQEQACALAPAHDLVRLARRAPAEPLRLRARARGGAGALRPRRDEAGPRP